MPLGTAQLLEQSSQSGYCHPNSLFHNDLHKTKSSVQSEVSHVKGRLQRWGGGNCLDVTSRGRWLQALVQNSDRQDLTFLFCLQDSCYSPKNQVSKARKDGGKGGASFIWSLLTRKKSYGKLFPQKMCPQQISRAGNCVICPSLAGYKGGWESQCLAEYKVQTGLSSKKGGVGVGWKNNSIYRRATFTHPKSSRTRINSCSQQPQVSFGDKCDLQNVDYYTKRCTGTYCCRKVLHLPGSVRGSSGKQLSTLWKKDIQEEEQRAWESREWRKQCCLIWIAHNPVSGAQMNGRRARRESNDT